MHERLINLTSADVQENMDRIAPEYSHTQELADKLSDTVFGQEQACQALARRVTIFESGLNDSNRPLGVEMFLGPTGVGKTEASHALAKHLFGDRDSEQLKIIDCAEFAQGHSIHRLVGSPPSYVGYGAETLITQDFLAKRNIIVFDEIEKAHPDLHRLLLGVMEDGRLRTTVRGGQETLDFANSLIIMTSNVGARELDDAKHDKGNIGFDTGGVKTRQEASEIATNALKQAFAPEFINRIDDVIVFKDLEDHHFDRIFYKFITEINDDLASKDIYSPFIGATQEFKDYIISRVDKQYGARDMRRQIDRELLEKLADVFMGMELSSQVVIADRDPQDNQTYFYTDHVPLLREEVQEENDPFYDQSCDGQDEQKDDEWEDKEADVQESKKKLDTKKSTGGQKAESDFILYPNHVFDINIVVRNKVTEKSLGGTSVTGLPIFPPIE